MNAKLLPIKVFSCPTLREPSRALKSEELQNEEIKQLLLDLEKTMIEKDGVGLAAPQVGHNIRVIVINTIDGNLVLVNPKILHRSWRQEIMEEGCLSLPEVFGMVKRSLKLKVSAWDRNGENLKFSAEGYFARILQHEIDHLDGILFIDKATEIVEGASLLKEHFKK